MNNNSPPFDGIGTLLFTDILGSTRMSELTPDDLQEVMGRHLEYVSDIIDAHSGTVYQFIGDAVAAYWHPSHASPTHAQLAFDAAREIIESLPTLMTMQKGLSYEVDIILGTGQMSGDTFGPIKQFQIIGIAKAIADRISSTPRIRGTSSIRMSQYTVEFIDNPGRMEKIGTVSRNKLDDLQIFSFCPSKMPRPEGAESTHS
jgi:adenylate cyclase